MKEKHGLHPRSFAKRFWYESSDVICHCSSWLSGESCPVKERITNVEEGLRKSAKRIRIRNQKALKPHTGCEMRTFILVKGHRSFAKLIRLWEGPIMEKIQF